MPIIVAINKMDKPTANADRIMQQLTEYELVPEEWSGETIICPISAKTGEGIDNLLETINEKGNNPTGYAKAVEMLGGPDNGGTRIFWDVDKPNF